MYQPDQPITRQDAAVMINRYVTKFGKSLPADAAQIHFTDEAYFAEYAKDAISELQKAEIIGGIENEDKSFKYLPNAYITREQASKMLAVLHRILNR
jgi:hypothetical protein